ncbi:hypothetical protein HMPREF0972_01452 [Actinomyces sp. oral taxon 848 str. F0332]|nr:hypothetical protein HMPREF0972_01452 [Actinomyces sp. oral taxon 848 str. F0332]
MITGKEKKQCENESEDSKAPPPKTRYEIWLKHENLSKSKQTDTMLTTLLHFSLPKSL